MDLRERIADAQEKAERQNEEEMGSYERYKQLLIDNVLFVFQDWLKGEVGKMEVIGDDGLESKAINQLVPINSELELTIAHNGALAQLEKDKSLLDKIERMME